MNEQTKHTLGPWHLGFRNGANGNMVMAYNGKEACEDQAICSMYGLPINCDVSAMKGERNAEGLANARLIAAAPELLEALRAYVEKDFEMGGTSSKAEIHNARLAAARAALNKAQQDK